MFARASARLAAAARPAMARAASTLAKPAAAATSSRVMLATVSAAIGATAYLQLSSNTALAAPAAPQPGQRIPPAGVVGTNYERTFIAIKPDGVQRGLINKIIARFEEKGFQLVGLKLIVPTEDLARGHYEGPHSTHTLLAARRNRTWRAVLGQLAEVACCWLDLLCALQTCPRSRSSPAWSASSRPAPSLPWCGRAKALYSPAAAS